MKELSIEQKAKAYDNIIEKANKMHSENCEACQMCIEELIPELKESEDERIRKELICYFEKYPSIVIGPFNTKECIAWLEKQDKPIDINPSEFDLHLNRLLKQFKTLPKEELASSLSFYLNVVQNNGTYKQGEQKPAWSEEDKEMSRFIGNAITADDASEYLESKAIQVIDAHVWLDGLRDRVQPQPKQEWSEEDETGLGDTLWAIQQARTIAKDENDMGILWCAESWLKSLKDRVQPQNKWKESLATADLENSLCDIQDAFSDTSYEYRILGEAIEFIRCTEPKPQWKPSDEQMKQLGWIAKQNKDNMIGKELMTLYQDLLKQREE